MKDFPWESLGCKGGGLSSTVQILLLAKPCCSGDPQFPNFTSIKAVYISKDMFTHEVLSI
jgi:hypothetical protein